MNGELLQAIRSGTFEPGARNLSQCAPQPLGEELCTRPQTMNSIARRTYIYNQTPQCTRPQESSQCPRTLHRI